MESTIGIKAAPKAVRSLLSACAASIALTMFATSGASARDIAPEIVSRVWLDGGSQVATVTLDGDEIARFKADDDDDEAAEEAEDLAGKLQEILSDKKFDANLLVPAREEGKAILKFDGNAVCSFDPLAGQDSDDIDEKKQATMAFDASTKLVNKVRVAFGAPPLSGLNEIADKPASKLEVLGQTFTGAASWYGGRFNGRKCSDGTRFNQERMTAAHRSLPFGTKILVKNRKTGDSCVVEVNDRGPFIDGRVIDLSKAAARELNMLSSGIAYVECTVLQ
ncbi:MAG: septal ring lytic transglycosylase RlpA family protein [Candidatus Obscuribacterales bacterium]|nr:septal ring lytic transglycosylase RlpA family protein [Candidatus Obscuribacterales bacterium]